VEGSPTPGTPYREGKALAEIIPPDRRREKTIALVGASMIAGVALWALGGWALEAFEARNEPTPILVGQTPGYVAGRLPQSMLKGPGGVFALPQPVRSVVHIWLQGCQDCMPAFNAMAQLQSEGGLNVSAPVVNVAYGEADLTWANRYGVGTNLVFDPGGASVVKPLGIGTFTTLVVEPDGTIIHRDRPDRSGFVQRVRSAVMYGNPNVEPVPTGDPLAVAPLDGAGVLDSAGVERVIATHRAGIKRTCWERGGRAEGPSRASVTIALTIGTDGRVTSSSSVGDDPVLARCIESQARTWSFPRPATRTSVNIPFKFVQE
jgi:hypothetical protein